MATSVSPTPSLLPPTGSTVDVSQAELTLIYLLCTGMSIVFCVMCTLCGRRPRTRRAVQLEDHRSACVFRPVVVTRKARDEEIREAKVCPICLEPLEPGHHHDDHHDDAAPDPGDTGGPVVADCGHPLHANCLAQWLLKDVRVTCPVCRAPYRIAETTTTVASAEPSSERAVAVREPGGVQTVIAFSDEAARDDSPRDDAPEISQQPPAAAQQPSAPASNARTSVHLPSQETDQIEYVETTQVTDEGSNSIDEGSSPALHRSGFENVVITGVAPASIA